MVKKKETTNEDLVRLIKSSDQKTDKLSTRMESGFKDSDKKFNDLMKLIKQGFDNVPTKKEFDDFKEDFNGLVQTVDNLALSTKRQFDIIDERFDKVEEKLETMDNKIETLDKKIDRIENIVTVKQDRRLERLEDGMRQTKTVLKIK
jgi:soluble cytochrome b562